MATAKQLRIEAADLEEGGGGAYAELEVPGDFDCYLSEVQDYEKNTTGWMFRYMVETPSGEEVKFDVYLSFGKNARWKLVQVLRAHGVELDEGVISVDPDDLVGDAMIATIDFPRDDDGEPTSKYREIRELFPQSSTPGFGEDDEPDGRTGQEEEPEIL